MLTALTFKSKGFVKSPGKWSTILPAVFHSEALASCFEGLSEWRKKKKKKSLFDLGVE